MQDSGGTQQSGAEGQNPPPHPVPTLLGMQPRAWLAFGAASAHHWVMASSSSRSTPKSFSAGLLSAVEWSQISGAQAELASMVTDLRWWIWCRNICTFIAFVGCSVAANAVTQEASEIHVERQTPGTEVVVCGGWHRGRKFLLL